MITLTVDESYEVTKITVILEIHGSWVACSLLPSGALWVQFFQLWRLRFSRMLSAQCNPFNPTEQLFYQTPHLLVVSSASINFCLSWVQSYFPKDFSTSEHLTVARQEFQSRRVICSFPQLAQLHVHFIQSCSQLGPPWGLDQFHQIRLRLESTGN